MGAAEDYFESRIAELEKQHTAVLADLEDIKERFQRADAKRAAEGGLLVDSKWAGVYELLEKDLRKARARLTSIEVEIHVKRQKLAEHRRLRSEEPAPEAVLETDDADVPAADAHAHRHDSETIQRVLEKLAANDMASVTFGEHEALADLYRQLEHAPDSDARAALLKKNLLAALVRLNEESERIRGKWQTD